MARRAAFALLLALLAAAGAAAESIDSYATLCASGSATPAKFKGKLLDAEGNAAGNIQLCWASPGNGSLTLDLYTKIKVTRVRALSAVVVVAGPLNTTVDLVAVLPPVDVPTLTVQLKIAESTQLVKDALCSNLLRVGVRSSGALQASSSVALSSGSCS